MKWLWICTLVVLPLLAFGSCGGDDLIDQYADGVPQGLLDEANCMGFKLVDARRVVFSLIGLYELIQDPELEISPPNLADYDFESDPNTFDLWLDLDEDGMSAETHVLGDLYPDEDLSNGLAAGESVDAIWGLEVRSVPEGSGTWRVTRSSAEAVNLTGTAVFGAGDCVLEVTSMNLTLVAEELDIGTPDGYINFVTNGGAMTGSFTFDPVEEIAHVSVTWDGKSFTFKFDLDNWLPIWE